MNTDLTRYPRDVADPAIARRRTWLSRRIDRCHQLVHPRGAVASPTGLIIATAQRISETGQPMQTVGSSYTRGLLQHAGLTAAKTSPPNQQPDTEHCLRFCWALIQLQADLLSTLLPAARHRLDHRTSEGSSLLSRQLVQGHIADVAVAVVETSALAEAPTDCDSAGRTHRRLVHAGRTLLPLFGASGFLVSGPGLDLHVIELIGNTYLPMSRSAGDA